MSKPNIRKGRVALVSEPDSLNEKPSVPSDTWLRGPEARTVVIDITIELLRTFPFNEVSIRRVASAAKIYPSSIQRNFGSMTGLFDAVTKELSARFSKRAARGDQLALVVDEDVVLRTRLVAWLLGQGADPTALVTTPGNPAREALIERLGGDAVSERAEQAFVEIFILLAEGYITFADVHSGLDAARIADGFALLGGFRKHLASIETDLGWVTASDTDNPTEDAADQN